jgi:hypothetical protein
MSKMMAAFALFDEENNGTLSKDDFYHVLVKMDPAAGEVGVGGGGVEGGGGANEGGGEEGGSEAGGGEDYEAGGRGGVEGGENACTLPLPAAFVDPPWGGIHYKRIKNSINGAGGLPAELALGEVALTDLIGKLCGVVSVLGVKVPLTYDLQGLLLNALPHGTTVCTNKKVFRQRLVVLALPLSVGSSVAAGGSS